MKNNNLYQNLQEYFSHTELELDILYYIKSGALILIGVLASATYSMIQNEGRSTVIYLITTILIFVLYCYVEHFRRKREKKFPLSILDNLNAEYGLQTMTAEFERKKAIDNYIDNSIKSLNLNTCNIYSDQDNHQLCEQSLSDGLSSVIRDLLDRINCIVDSNTSKFSIGIYYEGIAIKASQYREGMYQEYSNKIFKLRDDIGINVNIPEDIQSSNGKSGITHTFQTAFSRSFNHNKFHHTCIDINQIGHTLIVSPIQAICESDTPAGLIYIVVDDQIEIKDDTANILQIFGRIISNWVDKYNNCANSYFEKLKHDFLGITKFVEGVEVGNIPCCPVESEALESLKHNEN